ncbi:MAG: AAA family ATPase [Nanoarchaeota archaeon]
MKLVYIYGMPATGKLEVAKQLAKITDFKVFHNHLTADYVSNLFPERNKMSDDLKQEIALKMFEKAAKHNVNLIFTMVHQTKYRDFVKRIIEIIEKFNGEVLFIRLICKKEKLYERVVKDSRKEFDKVHTVKELKEIIKDSNKFDEVPFKKTLTIENTELSPGKCAEKIKKHYGL